MFNLKVAPLASNNNIGIFKVNGKEIDVDENGFLIDKIAQNKENYGQQFSSDAAITNFINGYYNQDYTLEDIQSIQAIGDIRNITIGAIAASGTENGYTQSVSETHHEQTIPFEILDFDHDNLTTSINGITKALITIQQKECLRHEGCSDTNGENNTENGYVRKSADGLGGQGNSTRRKQCNGGYYTALPNYIKNLIKPVDKLGYSKTQYASGTYTYSDYCFLPSMFEIFGTISSTGIASEGFQYAQYANTNSNRYKLPKQGSSSSYLSSSQQTRSPYTSTTNNYYCVYCTGSYIYLSSINYKLGLAPAFCL